MTVRHALLGILSQRPGHGYELHEAFEALAGGRALWDVKPAQVYTTLARLVDAGLVKRTASPGDGGPARHVHEITDAGRAEFVAWLGEGVHAEHHRDEFFLKLVLALTTGAADPVGLIKTQRTTLYRDLHELTARRAELVRSGDLAHELLLDKAIMHTEADLRWLEMAEARLGDMVECPLSASPPKRRGRPPGREEHEAPAGEAAGNNKGASSIKESDPCRS
ncbi:MAG: PadR family transcriptional regulator [Actinomycetia bacterium]|nr:PadR family transcriptional regulator [Actinomycetes bacterium]